MLLLGLVSAVAVWRDPRFLSPEAQVLRVISYGVPYTFEVVPIVARQAEVHQRRRLGQTHLPASVAFLVK